MHQQPMVSCVFGALGSISAGHTAVGLADLQGETNRCALVLKDNSC